MAEAQSLFYSTSLHSLGAGGRERVMTVGSGSSITISMWIACLSLLHFFLINITAVCFFISLMLPVNCSYPNPRSPAFLPPVLLSMQLQERGRGREEWEGGAWFGVVSAGILHLGAPFLNHECTSGHVGLAKILSLEYNIYFCFILSSYAAIQTSVKWCKKKKSLSGFLAGNACEGTSWPKVLMC